MRPVETSAVLVVIFVVVENVPMNAPMNRAKPGSIVFSVVVVITHPSESSSLAVLPDTAGT